MTETCQQNICDRGSCICQLRLQCPIKMKSATCWAAYVFHSTAATQNLKNERMFVAVEIV